MSERASAHLTTTTHKIRPWRRMITVLVTGIALVAPLAGTASAHSGQPSDSWRTRIDLPDNFQPEGITIGPGRVAYLGSRANGDIWAADLKTGKGKVISTGLGANNPSVGLKSDQRRLLYVSGGNTGTARVIDIRSGAIIANYTLSTTESFINDVVLARGRAWFTDSRAAKLYGVPLARHGRPAPESAITTLNITGDWVQNTAPNVFNANGIAASPDGRSLLVVQSNTGFLFRVDPGTGVAKRVDLGTVQNADGTRTARLLTNGDGLLVRGRTLYAVQNRLNTVAVYRLNAKGSQGSYQVNLSSPEFDIPTTVAAYGRSLYLPNARFSTTPTPTTPYWITRITTG